MIKRKWVAKLLYHPIEKVKEITENKMKEIVKLQPKIGILFAFIKRFKDIVFGKHVEELENWLKEVSESEIKELKGFVKQFTEI